MYGPVCEKVLIHLPCLPDNLKGEKSFSKCLKTPNEAMPDTRTVRDLLSKSCGVAKPGSYHRFC
jgi:hypothetical protein